MMHKTKMGNPYAADKYVTDQFFYVYCLNQRRAEINEYLLCDYHFNIINSGNPP